MGGGGGGAGGRPGAASGNEGTAFKIFFCSFFCWPRMKDNGMGILRRMKKGFLFEKLE